MPNDQTMLEYRVRESWRIRACTAGLCVGVQTFLFGTGVAMPMALGSAWIAAFAVLPAAALITAVCCRIMRQRFSAKEETEKNSRRRRLLHLLLSLTLLANAVFMLCALVSFAEQTLIGQTRAAWSAALAAMAAFLCALSGGTGVSRVCFALRWGLPGLMILLIATVVPFKTPVGLFPLLGAGAKPLGAACLCMLGAASPALMLLLPPPEMEAAGAPARSCPVPQTKFFLCRVLAGAGTGVALLFAAGAFVTYESVVENVQWGARLRVIAGYQVREGLRQMLLTVLQALAIALSGAAMLSSAEQALVCAFARMAHMRAGLIALFALLAVYLAVLIAWGLDTVLFFAPGLILPALILLMFAKRQGDLAR